jgi:hypothetical protein
MFKRGQLVTVTNSPRPETRDLIGQTAVVDHIADDGLARVTVQFWISEDMCKPIEKLVQSDIYSAVAISAEDWANRHLSAMNPSVKLEVSLKVDMNKLAWVAEVIDISQ